MSKFLCRDPFSGCADEVTLSDVNPFPSFLADYNIDPYVIHYLRIASASVVPAGEVGLAAASDDEIFDYATKHDKTIITHDKDFLNFKRFDVSTCSGIVILPARGEGRDLRVARAKLDAALNNLCGAINLTAGPLAGKLLHFDKKGELHLYGVTEPLHPSARQRPRLLASHLYM